MHVLSPVAATTAEYVPPAHSTHTPDPFTALCLPAPQASHGPPSGPVYPALHRHICLLVLWAGDMVFSGHVKHRSDVVAALVSE